MVTIRRGNRSRLLIAVAATASGGETIAPSANAAAHGNPPNACATTPIASVVTRTNPIASHRMGVRFARKSRHDVNSAAGYSNGGNTNSNTISGLSFNDGGPGRNPSARPATTSKTGYGNAMRFAAI